LIVILGMFHENTYKKKEITNRVLPKVDHWFGRFSITFDIIRKSVSNDQSVTRETNGSERAQ